MSAPNMNNVQTRIWQKAETGVAYTVSQMAALAGEFAADAEIGTPGMIAQFDELFMDAIDGLCRYGYFTPAVDPYGSALVLADWTFTRVDSPSPPDAPAPAVSWVIPWTVQGDLQAGVSP
jgi:hypothetical protein